MCLIFEEIQINVMDQKQIYKKLYHFMNLFIKTKIKKRWTEY